jgi:aspartate racemase
MNTCAKLPGSDNLLGIVGGLGPLASAEFLKTIYEQWLGATEQEMPRIVVYSDPNFLDRTAGLLNGGDDVLLDQLVEALTRLRNIGASRFVICCVTIHHVLPRVPAELRQRITSLIDVMFDELAASREPHLLLCTTGTRELGTFEKHERYPPTSHLFVLPDEMDQPKVHRMIYDIKRGQNVREQIPFVESLLDKYNVRSFIAGCTEIHLLSKHFAKRRGDKPGGCIDPLTSIALSLANQRVASFASAAR